MSLFSKCETPGCLERASYQCSDSEKTWMSCEVHTKGFGEQGIGLEPLYEKIGRREVRELQKISMSETLNGVLQELYRAHQAKVEVLTQEIKRERKQYAFEVQRAIEAYKQANSEGNDDPSNRAKTIERFLRLFSH